MPYNLKFYKTESATARCLAGTGGQTSYTASAESIIAQRDVDRKALGWAQAAARSMLECTLPQPAGIPTLVPSEGFSGAGFEGGPFSPSSKAYELTNTGTADMEWSVSGPAWLDLSPSSGFLYVGESVTVTASLNAAAEALSPGDYTAPIVFNNDTAGTSTSQPASLEVVTIPVPAVTAEYVSESGVATLIGHSEFPNASGGVSLPPKKYRTKTADGTLQECVSASLACAGPFSSAKYVYSGQAAYNVLTGALTNTLLLDTYITAGSCPAVTLNSSVAQGATWGDTTAPATTCVQTTTVTKTKVERVRSGACCDNTPAGGQSTTGTGTQSWELSDEDTDADALARAVKIPGTSPTAAHEGRGAGDFSYNFTTVAYSLNLTGLAPSKNYQVTLDLTTETYGGGSPVVTQRTYNFTAAASTHTINDMLTANYGEQVTASNPQVVLVP